MRATIAIFSLIEMLLNMTKNIGIMTLT